METLYKARIDRSTAHQGRSQIRRIARHPRPGDRQLVGLDAITLQILERTIAGYDDLVRERRESPALAARVSAAHQGIAPIQVAAAGDVEVHTLFDARVGKR